MPELPAPWTWLLRTHGPHTQDLPAHLCVRPLQACRNPSKSPASPRAGSLGIHLGLHLQRIVGVCLHPELLICGRPCGTCCCWVVSQRDALCAVLGLGCTPGSCCLHAQRHAHFKWCQRPVQLGPRGPAGAFLSCPCLARLQMQPCALVDSMERPGAWPRPHGLAHG